MQSPVQRLKPGHVVLVLVVAATYYTAARLGLLLAFEHTNASPVWPPSGIAFAIILLFGYRVWPGILFGAFLANVAVFSANLTIDLPAILALSGFIAVGNTLEAASGRFLLERLVGAQPPFEKLHNMARFVLVALLMCMISCTLGSASLYVAGIIPWALFGTVWFTWWIGDVGGVLVLAPLILIWRHPPRNPFRLMRLLEAAMLLGIFLVVMRDVFSFPHDPRTYLLLPPLLWATFRFGLRGQTAAVALVSVMATWATLHGFGPFVQESRNASLLSLQLFICVITITKMFLAATLAERQAMEDQLRKAQENLERRVDERTAELVSTNVRLRREISERKHAEAGLTRAHAQLLESHEELKAAHLQLIQAAKMESVGQLAAGVAHEVKNPLAVILQGIDYLSRRIGKGDERAVRVLRHTEDAVRRADGVIRGLLDFSASRELVLSAENINQVIEKALKLISHEQNRVLVTVEKRLAEGLPCVPMDCNKITQVFVNLFMNALHAMPAGGRLSLATSARRLDQDGCNAPPGGSRQLGSGEYVVAEVSDSGIGIPPSALERIFEPFFTTKPVGEGSGLGLTVTKKIVELHGGRIWVESAPGKGTTFFIALPYV